MIAGRRFRAPAHHGGLLADPAFAQLPEAIANNRRTLASRDVILAGMTLAEFRHRAIVEARQAVNDYRDDVKSRTGIELHRVHGDAPLLLTGHQPEFFHPGVWVKNFALSQLANATDHQAVNLIIDSDEAKSSALMLPAGTDAAEVHLATLPYDTYVPDAPYEERPVQDDALFDSLPERLEPLVSEWTHPPLLLGLWPCIPRVPLLGERGTLARIMIEQRCGLHNAELPFSRLSATPSFIRFVLHLLSDLPRFRDIYNRSVDDYRKVHGIRSRHHPVPNLAPDEAPFWIWREGETKRGRLHVKPSNQKLLLIGAGKPIEVAPDADRWPQGVKIRSRALITTMFARLALADLFIHGIGGGKYDEVTDAIIRDYWGITPPAYSVMSATLRLPLPAFAANRADVRKIRQKYRDLHSNPQRYLPAEMGAEKARLLANEPTGHRARKLWFRALQCATDALRPSVTAQLGSVSDQLHQANIQANANALRQRRDFSFLLYPEELLMKWLNELPNQGLIG